MSELTTEKLKGYLIEAGEHLKPSSLGHEHLREACHNPMENALFEFLYSTGCRIGGSRKAES
ncbi:hypothetical protein P4T56_22075 [Bacillus nitratireducens]|nr:hypothetical protein [Bacillus nitratireducens]